jgi:hypothetical protein
MSGQNTGEHVIIDLPPVFAQVTMIVIVQIES